MALNSTDPVDLLLGPDHDLVIDSDMYFVRGIEAVRQDLDVALKMFKGEFFLNLDEGVEWDQILGEKYDEIRTRDIISKRILSRPNIVGLLELRVSFAGGTRRLSISFRAKTEFGDLDQELEV